MIEILEPKWVKCFRDFFELSGVKPGDLIGVLAESQSRQILRDPYESQSPLHS